MSWFYRDSADAASDHADLVAKSINPDPSDNEENTKKSKGKARVQPIEEGPTPKKQSRNTVHRAQSSPSPTNDSVSHIFPLINASSDSLSGSYWLYW